MRCFLASLRWNYHLIDIRHSLNFIIWSCSSLMSAAAAAKNYSKCNYIFFWWENINEKTRCLVWNLLSNRIYFIMVAATAACLVGMQISFVRFFTFSCSRSRSTPTPTHHKVFSYSLLFPSIIITSIAIECTYIDIFHILTYLTHSRLFLTQIVFSLSPYVCYNVVNLSCCSWNT